MARKLDDIFNECYERIRSGESLESCLMRYPEHAAELELLLKTALDIGRRASYIQPRPEFKHWALVRLEGEQHYARQQRQPAKSGSFSWRQGWSVAVAVILILLLTGSGTVIASSNTMPDEPLYPVKLATEEVRLFFAVTDAQKAQVQTQLVETRAVEVETMANEGKPEHAAITAARLVKQLELANAAIDKVEAGPTETPAPTPPPETTVTPPVPPTPPETVTGVQQPPADVPPAPPETVTGVQQPPAEVPPAPPETVTGVQQPPAEVPPAPPETVTGVQQPPADVPPAPPETVTGVQQPPAEVPPTGWQQTPPTTDNVTPTRFEPFKRSLDKSTSKSLEALDNAKEKASPQTKKDWQRAMDTIWERGREKQSESTPFGPSQPTTPSDTKTDNGAKTNPSNPSQNQPSPSKWQRNR